MATIPVSGTNIRLLSGIPFNADYKNTRWFDSLFEQTNYFQSKTPVHSMTQANFQRIEGYHFIAVNKSIDELRGVNYVMFQNEPYSSKWFYAFVTNLEYRQGNNTRVYFELDVFQTWWFDVDFKPSYVEREHCKLWNDDGSPVINTIDEGLDYGTDYQTVSIERWKPFGDVYFLVIGSKTAIDQDSNGDISPNINGMPTPLTYYVHPFKMGGGKPIVHVDQTTVDLSDVTDTLKAMYTQVQTVNDIVTLYITDHVGGDIDYDESTDTMTFNNGQFNSAFIGESPDHFITLKVDGISNYDTDSHNFQNKYNNFENVKESKLLMYPYCVTLMDDFRGNRIEIKNEYIEGGDLNVEVRGSMGTSNKVVYAPRSYTLDGSLSTFDETIMSLEYGLINNEPNDIPILASQLSAYLQGNKNQLQNQRQMIETGAIYNGIGNMASGIGSAMMMNPMGVGASMGSMIGGFHMAMLQIQQLQAKKQDISNKPPQVTKMGSNTSFSYGNDYSGVYVIKKQIMPEYRRKLEDYFTMFGYKKHEVKQPNFHTRENFNYVKTVGCTILGEVNNEDLLELKKVFDNGVTFWHTDDVGNYSLSNGVI